ncbi:MAG: DUF1552 domain-containing protein [Archangiaceae bacterium]|nr:DUF1552 domain-containing protein [Archangiaceae bacterium]
MLTRRGFLWTSGAVGLLPVLEAFLPSRARAQSTQALRFVGMFHTNGCVHEQWRPSSLGAGYALPFSLAALAPVRSHVSVISNLRLGPTNDMGSHGGGQRCFLTASDTLSGTTSLDVAIGKRTESQVRLPTLNLSLENNGYYWPPQIVADSSGIYQAPNGEDREDRCRDGDSCLVSVSSGTPVNNVYHPQVIYERLFGTAPAPGSGGGSGSSGQSAAALKEAARRRRVVDLAKAQANRLKGRIGSGDQKRVDEYLEGLRAIERELDGIAATPTTPPPPAATCDKSTPVSGIPVDRDRYAKLLCDLIVRGFQCDATRSVTYMLGQGVSPMKFTVAGVTYSHHGDASHHGSDAAKINAKAVIDAWQVSVFAYLVQGLAAAKDPDGTPLIDRTALFYSSDIADSDRHDAVDMPVLLGGRLGGALHPGTHLDGANHTTGDLFVSLLQAFGSTATTFGKFGTAPMGGL